jgi:hypothetical protein
MPQPLTIQQFQRQRSMYLSLLLLPLVLSLLTRWGIRFSLWGCPLVKWIGVPCMGWGMTRSFYATAQGNLHQAMSFHLFGPLFVLGFAFAGLHFAIELCQGRSLKTFYTKWFSSQRIWLLGFFVITGYHMTRLISLSQTGQIQQWFEASIVGQWF